MLEDIVWLVILLVSISIVILGGGCMIIGYNFINFSGYMDRNGLFVVLFIIVMLGYI